MLYYNFFNKEIAYLIMRFIMSENRGVFLGFKKNKLLITVVMFFIRFIIYIVEIFYIKSVNSYSQK